ncbi:MAG: prepilin-type N-terminal cleavage/methylation domain-containing protein [Rubrivivax sp.]|nr:MAG: prepilin-type N-terminal cleavage/methylation domain-containing protein [Rubrivivax sp.]
MKAAIRHLATAPSKGFTLIELMVGMALGLITSLIIAQVMVNYEGQKRTTTNGGDAQTNGSLAIYTLQQDIQKAGYGLINDPTVLGCAINGTFGSTALVPAFTTSMTLAPVVITPGTGSSSDTIRIMASDKANYSVPTLLATPHAQTDTSFGVQSVNGALDLDLMIVVPDTLATGCRIFTVKSDGSTPVSATTIPHLSDSGWNQTNVFPAAGFNAGSRLINLGKTLYRDYAVGTGGLTMMEVTGAAGISPAPAVRTLFPQTVLLKALYGKDTNADGVVDTYNSTTPTSNAEWLQVLSIRVALVMRSGLYEKDEVTTSAPLWHVGSGTMVTGSADCGSDKCLTLSLPGMDWKHYRYKVFDTVIPLRNMLWNS